MVRHLAALVEVGKFALKYGPKVITAEQRLLRGIGYSHKSAQGISHGLFAGAVVGRFINKDNGIEPDGEIQKPNGTQTYKQNKTRSRYQRSDRSKRGRCIPYRKYNRYSNSSRNR